MPVCLVPDNIDMPTQNVILPDHQTRLVEQIVNSNYKNDREVPRDGSQLVETREPKYEICRVGSRKTTRIGIGDIETGALRTFGLADDPISMAALTSEVTGP